MQPASSEAEIPRRIRLAIDARPLVIRHSGISRYTRALIAEIAEDPRFDVSLYSHSPITASFGGQTRQRTAFAKPLPGTSTLVAQVLFPLWARQDQIDVFWSPRHHLPLALTCSSAVTIHDLVWKRAPATMKPFGKLLDQLLTPASVRKADVVLTDSDATRADLLSLLPGAAAKCQVVYPGAGLDPDLLARIDAPTTAQRPPYLLFVGTFEPRKNLRRLLDAYQQLQRLVQPTPRLVLAGNQGWKFDITRELRERQLESAVDVVFGPPDADLYRLYEGCLFLTYPSLYEGFGLPIIEAGLFGKTCLTSNVSSMPEVVGDAGLTVDPRSVEAVAAGMARLLQDHPLRRQFEDRAKANAERFTWQRSGRQLAAMLAAATDRPLLDH